MLLRQRIGHLGGREPSDLLVVAFSSLERLDDSAFAAVVAGASVPAGPPRRHQRSFRTTDGLPHGSPVVGAAGALAICVSASRTTPPTVRRSRCATSCMMSSHVAFTIGCTSRFAANDHIAD